MRTHPIAAGALLAAALLAVTGCSSDPAPAADKPVPSASGPAPATSEAPKVDPERARLEAAVRAYSDAYFKPDGKAAYNTLSKRCQGKAGPPELFSTIVDKAAKAYGKQQIQTFRIDQLAGDMARVTYTYSVPALDQTSQPWVKEGGAWRYDGC
ncbi:hypothetical protein [Streptomyces antimicrobicus]|uniref:Lipoprotein n=1 Tax=Streptomyces antimicrobicus TaxID=2883108 RepID=A0ABS8B6E8_9ACTN|nr:hypothetical protein [Streptomyces antimicrobicus]MCB5180173.1 hypothetical protein [Streptomyces antimicrobicus]